MLLTITCARPPGAAWPATDLGFLLHKNPARVQVFEQSYGAAHVVYPEATEQRCTAALLLEIDPIRLVRGKSRGAGEFSLGQYVNDRPYAASSLLAVAISTVFGTALHGRCAQRPELTETALPLRIELPAVPCTGGPEIAERIFAPLGWQVTATPIPLDPAFPDWGESHYLRLELTGALRLSQALSHLYVLLPVLDGSKHYWLAQDEIDKLLRAGADWLPTHPERAWITRRYLARRQSLVRAALARLAEIDDATPEQLDAVEEPIADIDDSLAATAPADLAAGTADLPSNAGTTTDPDTPNRLNFVNDPSTANAIDPTDRAHPADRANTTGITDRNSGGEFARSTVDFATSTHTPHDPSAAPPHRSLTVTRRAAVVRALRDLGAHRVLDLGCGEGALLRELAADREFTEIVGVDVSTRALHVAQRRMERLPAWMAQRVRVRQGALTYTDAALRGYDAAVLMEVIEHVDPPRLAALEHAVFGSAAPKAVVVTTPNAEYNALYEGLPAGTYRHTDHRFEWSRTEFAEWSRRIAETYGYTARFEPIGPMDERHGSPTQMAIFVGDAREGEA
ncbi:3' terminal RNA ribose 2'-O-methyltransferase Hen1 [Nocardia sp. CDC141]|uniref:Small RNA 2'-O-methyltransferase n=1 Tax=Nocardia pulmonis TaxID=2951408 RepID=A0A9X2J249_9NOCA|nr:3' terminal RNA ribose 2'-O-methyltransferase Hen1 [Nocardia pulmonis]MCM6777656.1 3' terminal RNA ribose 2'-O-methyltransferase Hen1 [Nocardia pulmonis]